MGTGTREADRLAEQQNDGPFLVLFDVGGGEFMSPTLADTIEDVAAHVESAEKASDGNVTVRSIKLSKVLAAPQLVKALTETRNAMTNCRRLMRNYADGWEGDWQAEAEVVAADKQATEAYELGRTALTVARGELDGADTRTEYRVWDINNACLLMTSDSYETTSDYLQKLIPSHRIEGDVEVKSKDWTTLERWGGVDDEFCYEIQARAIDVREKA